MRAQRCQQLSRHRGISSQPGLRTDHQVGRDRRRRRGGNSSQNFAASSQGMSNAADTYAPPSARQTKRTRNRQERARGHNTAKTRVSSKGCFRGQVFGALIDGAAPCWETQSDSSRSGIGISAPYLPEDRSRLQSQTQPTRGAAGHGYLRNTPQKSFCSRRPVVIDQRFDL